MTTGFWIAAAAVLVVIILVSVVGPSLHIYGDTTDESALAGMDNSVKSSSAE